VLAPRKNETLDVLTSKHVIRKGLTERIQSADRWNFQ